MMYDLIAIGDSMQDIFVELKEAEILTDTKHMKLNLCVTFADKIPAEHIEFQVAGNSANAAVGATRLGLRCAFYTVIGDDAAGKMIRDKMEDEGVAGRYIVTDKGKMNNYSVVLTYQGERTIILYHQTRHYQLPKLLKVPWVYFSSLGNHNPSFLKLHDNVLEYIHSSTAKLAFNPGTYQLRMPIPLLRKVISKSHILFVNVQEAQRILGAQDKINIKNLLFQLGAFGPKIVVITDGSNGAYAYQGNHSFYHIEIFPSQLVERTGAGDSFAIAFLAALAFNHDVPTALRWGAINSASVVSKVGPQPGLLRKAEILAILRKHPGFQAKKI